MSHPPPRQMLTLQIASAIGWAFLAQWPWSPWGFHVLLAQAVLHVISPFWFHSIVRIRPVHLACLVGPIALAVIDAAFLVFAWKVDLWRDLTTVFVPLLGGAGIIALSYATSVMIVLDRRRARRERTNHEPRVD